MSKLRKLLIGTFVSILLAVSLTSCNKMVFDVTYQFNYAYVVWPDGHSEKLKIKAWADYDGEQIQIQLGNGNVYLFSSVNCVLGKE